MFEILEKINYLLVFIALGLNIYVVRSFGKGILNILFTSFSFAIFFTGASMLYSFLQDSGFYSLDEVSFHIFWHILIYLSLASIVWGGHRIKKIVDTSITEGFGQKDIIFYSVLTVVMLVIFTASPAIDTMLGSSLDSSIINTWGLTHFAVFMLALFSSWYLFYVKGHWGIIGSSLLLIIWFTVFIGGQHFWELLTESWKVIKLEDKIIENVELLFVFPALLSLTFAQWKLARYIKGVNSSK